MAPSEERVAEDAAEREHVRLEPDRPHSAVVALVEFAKTQLFSVVL